MVYLGMDMANLINLFNPELIAIGGEPTNMSEGLFEPVRRAIERRAFPAAAKAAQVVPAELGNDVGRAEHGGSGYGPDSIDSTADLTRQYEGN